MVHSVIEARARQFNVTGSGGFGQKCIRLLIRIINRAGQRAAPVLSGEGCYSLKD
jgi:hypothetical protein